MWLVGWCNGRCGWWWWLESGCGLGCGSGVLLLLILRLGWLACGRAEQTKSAARDGLCAVNLEIILGVEIMDWMFLLHIFLFFFFLLDSNNMLNDGIST